MRSPLADRVIAAAHENGVAFLKRISPNDLGITGAHQRGYYLPKAVAKFFTPDLPVRGLNSEHEITIDWSDGHSTSSVVKWYGKAKNEYRITRYNRIPRFHYLLPERLGSVLVLVQSDQDRWLGDVLERDDDVDEVLAALGLTLDDSSWALYSSEGLAERSSESTSECEKRKIENFAEAQVDFPTTRRMAAAARDVVNSCNDARVHDVDQALLELIRVEYDLFRAVERNIIRPEITKGFRTVEDFLSLSQTVLQRRKSRAGRSFEYHLEDLFRSRNVPFESQPMLDGTRPDFVFPSAEAYARLDGDADTSGVLVVTVKTTCKDRWRQALAEGPKVSTKYLITLQQGISQNQMREIRAANVKLVVPVDYHEAFAPDDRDSLVSLEDFIQVAEHLTA